MHKKLLNRFSIILIFLISSVFSNAQLSYTFSGVAGTYTANAAPTTIHAAGVDDALSAAINIGFTFNYGCTNYTQIKVSSNGWFTFNTAVTGTNAFNNLATSTDRPMVAPLWDDLAVGAGSTVNYKLTGTSPNRILTIEWSQMEWTYTATTWAVGFQAKLYETTNVIEFIYNRNGSATNQVTAGASASIGISGTTSGQFYSLDGVGGAPAASTVTETSNLASKPSTGQIYRWTPAAACSGTPSAGTATPSPASVCSGGSSTITLTGFSTGCGISYQWQSAPAIGGPYTNIAAATSTTYVATGITAVTYYRCITTCSNSGLTNTSSIATVTLTGAPTYATLPYTQSFEGPWLSVCDVRERPDASWLNNPATGNRSWRRDDDGVAGGAWTSNFGAYTPVFSAGARSARFHAYNTALTGALDLYVNCSPVGTKSLCFDYILNSFSSANMTVLLSTDGGATFPTTLGTITTANTWTSFSYPITSTSATCVVRFLADGDNGSYDIGLDNLNLSLPSVPNCATYSSPANGATGITCGINAILNWASGGPSCSPPTSYDVYFGTSATPPFVVNQTAISYNPGTLLPSTTYYWKIVPQNGSGAASGCVTWSFTTGATFSGSSTTPPITDGFESCLDWTLVNGVATNQWRTGTATNNGGANAMYISNDAGVSNAYTNTAATDVHFYKDITLPAGMTTSLSFDWKGVAESCCDYIRVYLAPTTYTPVSGTAVPGGYQLGSYIFNNQATWQSFNYALPSCGGTTMRLIFSWHNDGSAGPNPPGAIDNININAVTTTGQTCANPVNITLPYSATGHSTMCMNDDYTNLSVASCGSSFESGEDKVYKAVIGSTGCISVSISNANDNSIGFQVYNGCPDVPGSVCIGNYGGASAGALSGDISITATGTYYFVVDNFAGPANVDYDISISAVGGNAPNDPACTATALTLGIAANGDNTCTNATGEPGVPACWSTGALNTVWYTVTVPASGDVYIRTTAISLLNTQIAAYTTTNCASAAAYTYINCNDNAPICGGGTTYQNSELLLDNVAAPGTTLYIRVDGYLSTAGTFSILAIDGNNGSPAWPAVPGQDCVVPNPVCAATMSVGNPGYFAWGNVCDFPSTSTCLASGERSTVWYTININANANLTFDIVPNDYGNPNPITGQANPSYSVAGDETDYDFAMWKITGTGSTTCAGIAAGAAAIRCNYGGLGVTGLFSAVNGTAPAAYPGFGSAYMAQLPVTNGEVYVLAISNFANDYVAGFSLVFGGSPPPIAMTATTTSVTWAGTSSTSWIQPGNWSNACSAPTCGISAVIAAGGAQPIIAANASVNNLTINAGATLTINPGVTLTICGNYTNNGTLIADPTSTILFNNAAVTHTISGSVTGSNKFGNLTINKTGGSVVLAANLDVAGTFTTQNATSILNAASFYFKLGGNFMTASNVTLINCPTIEFNGVSPQLFTNTAGTHLLTNVVMNNTSSGLTLTGTANSNMVIAGALTLNNGVLYTATTPILIMNAGSTATSGSTISFVDGPMQKIGATAFVFPVGDAFNRWARIAMTAPSVSSTFQAQYFFTAYSDITTMAVTPSPVLTYNVSAYEYWQCDRVAGTGNASLTLYWENAASSGINSCAPLPGGDLVVARWNGSAWENRSNTIVGGITGSCVGSGAGTVSSDVLTAFSPFTFGSKSATVTVNPLPVELLSFTGKTVGAENILEWSTATENNNDYFTLERSSNGYEFQELKVVDGAGNSNSLLNYMYEDISPIVGMNYYRLKQTDFDGYVKYCPTIIALEFTKPTEFVIYPNPSTDNITLFTSTSENENVEIEITDVTGRVLLSNKQMIIKSQSNSGTSININNFAEGTYYIMIRDTNGKPITQKRFTKIK